jgi:TonB-dependent receptor
MLRDFRAALLCAAAVGAFAQTAFADESTVEQVIVTAPRRASTARTEQLTAPNLVNIQAADTIEKYPDTNAAEALGRIPGVSLSIDTGEGRFVTVRGIDSNLDGATFGGVVLLNSFPGGTYFSGTGRAVEFDTVPIGAVDRIEVTKTGLPDHEAEGIGGSIELSPRSIHNAEPFLDAKLGLGYENLRDSWAPWEEQVTVGGSFGFGSDGLTFANGQSPSGATPFSFVITQFQHNDRRSIDDFEEAYGIDNASIDNNKVFDTGEFRRYDYFRRRFGLGGELDFDPNDSQHYYVRADVAGYTENVYRQRLLYGNLEFDGSGNPLLASGPVCAAGDPGPCTYNDPAHPGGFLAPSMNAQATLRNQRETHRNTLYAAGGRDRIGDYILDYQIAYTEATYHKPYDRNWTLSNPTNYDLAYNNTANSNFPTFNVLSGPNVLDPTLYTLSGFSNSEEKDRDRETSGGANLFVPLDLFTPDDDLKFGFKLRAREKTVVPTSQRFSYLGANTLANFEGGGPFTYYDNLYSIGFRPDGAALISYFHQNPLLFSGGERVGNDLSGYYRDNEDITAGYAELNTTIMNVGVLAGVRVEGTDATYRGYEQGLGSPTLVANKQNYLDAFPTVQLRKEFMPDLIGRLTYSTGIARPGFSQVTATTAVDVGGATVSTGNPSLHPTYANNFDASLQYFLPGSGILSLGAFDKEMSNYIVTRTVTTNTFQGINQIWHISTFENASAYARGIEFEYVQKFLWAPPVFSDFGIDANLTYVDSQVALFQGTNSLLPGTSPWTGNVALYYEAHGLNLRVAGEYVGHNLFTVGGDSTTNVYEDKRFQVDFSSSYAITENISAYFDVKNLNNEPLRFYEGSRNRPVQREFYLQTFEFGVKLHL